MLRTRAVLLATSKIKQRSPYPFFIMLKTQFISCIESKCVCLMVYVIITYCSLLNYLNLYRHLHTKIHIYKALKVALTTSTCGGAVLIKRSVDVFNFIYIYLLGDGLCRKKTSCFMLSAGEAQVIINSL